MGTEPTFGRELSGRVNALTMAWCINTFAYSIAYPFLPIYLNGVRGFSMGMVGTMFLVMGIARVLAPVVCGTLLDRFGRRGILLFSPACRGICFLVLAAAVHWEAGFWTLAALLFLVMFIGGFFQNASDTYLSDITPRESRPEAFSRVLVGLNIGWMAGPAVGAFLAKTPFSMLFAITGILCFASPLIIYWRCPESSRRCGAAGTAGMAPCWRRSAATAVS